jgi:16S rRNA C1402 (ribose-2'-O) methylase RsmI
VLAAVPSRPRTLHLLFARHGLATRLVSYHARNATARGPELLAHLRGGADLALVTDAGTPLVSDPGGELVAALAAEGGAVVPIPGPSAVLAGLVASGIAGPRWAFEDSCLRSGRGAATCLARWGGPAHDVLSRRRAARRPSADPAAACGGLTAAVCRELTKIHEEVRRVARVEPRRWGGRRGRDPARGEVIVIGDDGAGAGADRRWRREATERTRRGAPARRGAAEPRWAPAGRRALRGRGDRDPASPSPTAAERPVDRAIMSHRTPPDPRRLSRSRALVLAYGRGLLSRRSF